MKIILQIARAELRNLFYSPIAWAVFVIFFLAIGIPFVMGLTAGAHWQQHIRDVVPSWASWEISLTNAMFQNLAEQVFKYLYLFVPLLTMGIINREVNAGTIKLLYSSPIRSREIVLGKYLGFMVYASTFVLAIGLLSVAGVFSIANADYKIIFSSIAGVFLLTGAYAAIGLFISSLTNYQIVAGVVTFIVFFLLHIMGSFWQQYDFVRDLTWFLSISGRATSLAQGLITTKDVIYYILIIALFLSFSLIKLRSLKESGSWRISFYRYIGVFLAVLLLGYLSSRPGYIGYLDVTRNQLNTIHPVTQKVISELGDEPLTVTLYTNLFDGILMHGLPQSRNKYVWNFWGRYVRFHPNIRFKYVYYFDIRDTDSLSFKEKYPKKSFYEVAEDLATANGLSIALFKTPREIRSLIDLDDEGKKLVMQLEYKGKKTFLRIYEDEQWPWPEEMHVSAAIRRLVRDTMPLVLFTSGHYERSPYKYGEREYSNTTLFKKSQTALLNVGADVDTIRLSERNIPATTSILVVADPKSALLPEEAGKIGNYLHSGGNAIFYGESGKQEMLNPILQSIGVRLDNGTIVMPNPHEMPDILEAAVTDVGGRLAGEPFLYRYQKDTSKKLSVKLPGSVAISYEAINGFSIEPILAIEGNDSYWIENGHLVVDSAAPVFSAQEGDLRKSRYVAGIKMYRTINNKEQRIVIFGDADFMSDFRGKGEALGIAAYSWALYNEYPKYTNRPLPTDSLLLIDEKSGKILYVVYLFVIPGLVLLLGTIILIRRNRK